MYAKSHIALVAALLLAAPEAQANPQGGEVVAGSASISAPSPDALTVTQQTDKAVINWQSFSIGQSESVNFAQPSSSSIALNRVIGGDLSTIAGALTANGNIFLVNPNGVVFTKTAKVDVNGLLATTSDIANDDFMAGRFSFTTPGNPNASIVNQGRITAAESGLIGLVAPSVENDGIIAARLGRVSLGSGDAFTFDFYGDQLISFAVPTAPVSQTSGATKPLVANRGTIQADGGIVWLAADTAGRVVDQAVSTTGIIEARAVHQQGGDIVLDGGEGGTVVVSGTLDASGKAAGQTGGTVKVLGANVALNGGAAIDVSGDAGGGTALVGGNFHGAGPERNAQTTTIASSATLAANALRSGDGGQVAVWSDGQTNFYGSIFARGGAESGNGGFVEVSGHKLLNYAGTTDLRAPNGMNGTLLLDPEDVTIASTGDAPSFPTSASGGYTFNPTSASSFLAASTLQQALALADVTVTTGSAGSQSGDITVASSFGWSSGSSLTLSAYRNVIVNSGVTITYSGYNPTPLALHADNTGTGAGTVQLNGYFSSSTGPGYIAIYYNTSDYTHPTNYASHVLGGAYQTRAYMLVNNVNQLQLMQNNLSGAYALGRDVDATITAVWNGGAGFVPVGSESTPFTGYFDGAGHSISNLKIFGGVRYAGLFGYIHNIGNSAVQSLNLNNAMLSWTYNAAFGTDFGAGLIAGYSDAYITDVSSSGGTADLVGFNDGTIIDATVTNLHASGDGSVFPDYTSFGAIAGVNNGSIYGSSASGSITDTGGTPASVLLGSLYLGGLVGFNTGLISDSHASVTINGALASGAGDGGDGAGGLVGWNGGDIYNSYATGSVTSGAPVGGLVGFNSGGQIFGSYATGNVSGNGFYGYGGLVGMNTGTILAAYARGSVTSTYSAADVGGLVGSNFTSNASITEAYSTGLVTGTGNVGGLVGYEDPTASVTYGYWDTQTSGRVTSAAGTGKTTSALTSSLQPGFSPADWSFTAGLNNGYPHLPLSGSGPVSGPTAAVNFGVSPQTQQAFVQYSSQADGRNLGTKFPAIADSNLQIVTWAIDLTPISQLDTSEAVYGSLDALKNDPYFTKHTVAVESETCLAVGLTMIARAAGNKNATVNDYWISDNTNHPAQNNLADPSALKEISGHSVQLSSWGPYETSDFKNINLTPGNGITSTKSKNHDGDAAMLGTLNGGNLALLGGSIASGGGSTEAHWMLGIGTDGSKVIANDPWTGTQVEIDTEGPNAWKVSAILDPSNGRFVPLDDVITGKTQITGLPTAPNGQPSYSALKSFDASSGGFVTVTIK